MSAPPPAYPPVPNPDNRPLPEGYISRWDENYRAWYYVDTRGQSPRSSWAHPLGQQPSPQQSTNYAPPPNPPSNRYNSGSPSFPSQFSGGPQQYNQTTPYPSGYQGSQDQRNFSGGPPQPYPAGPQGYGYPGAQGWSQGGGWQQSQQPPSQGYPQQQPPRSGRQGMGTAGTALLAGGGGLVAGALLGEVFEHHEDEERQEAYDQGYDNGQDGGDYGGGGGDFDGGGW